MYLVTDINYYNLGFRIVKYHGKNLNKITVIKDRNPGKKFIDF
jgi:hypothetical protein